MIPEPTRPIVNPEQPARWQPHVTVAAIIEKDARFLLVEECINGQLLLNQPAGHWENGETLIDAISRETLEETAWHFKPEYLVGIYQWQPPEQPQSTFLRFAFAGSLSGFEEDRELDSPITRTLWYKHQEIKESQDRHRSPQLLRCVEDYLKGKRYPLQVLNKL